MARDDSRGAGREMVLEESLRVRRTGEDRLEEMAVGMVDSRVCHADFQRFEPASHAQAERM